MRFSIQNPLQIPCLLVTVELTIGIVLINRNPTGRICQLLSASTVTCQDQTNRDSTRLVVPNDGGFLAEELSRNGGTVAQQTDR